MRAHQSLYKSWPCVDLDLIYCMVNFGTLGFYIGKRLNSGFLRNYLSLRYNTWYIWSTKWPDEDIMSLKVKVIPSDHPSSRFSNIFSSETTGPIEAKFHMESQWDVGTKVYIFGPGHMTKMAATPIYGKNPSKIFFSRTKRPMTLKLGM